MSTSTEPPGPSLRLDQTERRAAPAPITNAPDRIIWTRQLSQRNMPESHHSEPSVVTKSQTHSSSEPDLADNGRSPKTSSTLSTCLKGRLRSPTSTNKIPLTREQSPLVRATRKRTAAIVEAEDKDLETFDKTPIRSRGSSGDSTTHVCICQPEPKIPRPRNAFILYRQQHQAQIAAEHPGLANPEISKIIGEQWQKQPQEIKNKWKVLAEEEKIRHQQQYPTYRYQPKRNERRNSLSSELVFGEKSKCPKCGRRSILAASSPLPHSQAGISPVSEPPTPSTLLTPVTRTLPGLKGLSLQSPGIRRMEQVFHGYDMSPLDHLHGEDRDELGPMSPGLKRRKYTSDQSPSVTRVMPPHYGLPPPASAKLVVGPGTPFPFNQAATPSTFQPAASQLRHESLPDLRGVVSAPATIGPPPRPSMGYHQHRISQGHVAPHQSLMLPPLNTRNTSKAPESLISVREKTLEEQIMSMPFRYKIKILGQVAPPASDNTNSRGPLIAVEGDDAQAVAQLARWLYNELKKGEDLAIRLFESPAVATDSIEGKPMVQCHQLAAEWLSKSEDIVAALSYPAAALLSPSLSSSDLAMQDATPTQKSPHARNFNEGVSQTHPDPSANDDASREDDISIQHREGEDDTNKDSTTNLDNPPSTTSPRSSVPYKKALKPVGLIANYSLHASNIFACRIPIGLHDPYSPSDHWQWTATQWRGIVGPDLTIFLRDAMTGESGKPTVEILEEGNLFVMKRTYVDGSGGKPLGLEASVLRRLGFEVEEWIRAFEA